MFVRAEIAAMTSYIPGEQPKPGEAVKLNTNENPYRASERVYQAVKRQCDEGLSRYPSPFGDAFRDAAAEIYGVDRGMILCGNGSDDLLTILIRTFVGNGEWLRLPCPSYSLYRSLAEIQGAESEEIRFNADWSLPDTFFAAKDGLKLAILPNPNSPSGTMIPKAKIQEMAERLPCPLVVDEAYADFADFNCIDLVRMSEKILVTRTLSKAYSLAGLRFGYLFAPPALIHEMSKVKDSYNCDTLSITAATEAVRDQEWRIENRSKILVTRKRLTERMRKLGFTVPDSQANFTWNVHPTADHKRIYEYLKLKGTLVRYMNYADAGDGLRISVGTDQDTDRCLDLIEEYCDKNL
ncbi:MAG: histidinol-phosphate transaminase [Planctomycetaceae bacterium]|jgi:histidinol-phosphate aminotransferase|nr:histidinol-phosphate transaminase [Planctomycetaceae bacterium]